MSPDLNDLLSAWMGRDIDPGRRDEVVARLRSDAAFRREFVDEIWMLGKLSTVQSPESRWLRLEDELGWGEADAAPDEPLEDRIARELGDRPQSVHSKRASWLAVAAALMVLAIGGALGQRWLRPANVPQVQFHPKIDTSAGLGMIVKLEGVRWDEQLDPNPVEGEVLGPGRLRFAAGRVVISMLTGVVLDIEGPADFELINSDQLLCHRGKIRARVPDGAEGFRVLGPSAAVVDLGTEFGLNVGSDGKSRGRIFKGKLEAALIGPAGTPERSIVLDYARSDASQAFEIDARSGRLDAVAASDEFIAASPLTAPALRLTPEYSAAVLRAKPWGYWRFNSLEGGVVANEVLDRPPLQATGPIRLESEPGGNRWAVFRPVQGPQYFDMREDWHPTWMPGFAVEYWCLSESISHASLASLVAPRNTDHHVFLMELTSRNRLTIHKPASVRCLHRWPAGWEGGDNAYSGEPYVPYRWHHLVGQVIGDRIELYLDGRLSSTLSIAAAHDDVACQFVVGRLTGLPGSGLSVDRPFVGRLDELALYDHPLSPQEIDDHRREGMATRNRR